jgi:Tfp pilus assembly protein PilF
MAELSRIARAWGVGAGLSVAVAGCSLTSKKIVDSKPAPPASTAVSGSGDFAPDTGAKNPEKVHLAYGQWQEQMGQQAEARDSYGKVLAKDPKNLEALLGMARLDQASGLTEDAENRIKKAMKLAPKDPRVLATYGNFYGGQGEWKKAVEKHQAAVKQAPDDPRYQFLLGVALARSGDVDGAFPYFIRSVGDAQAHYNLGYILFETGQKAGALQHFEQALALKPDLEPAQAMVDRIQQRGGATILAHGAQAGGPATPISSVRSIPVTRHEGETVPLRGNEAALMRGARRTDALPQNSPHDSPHSGATAAQLEQLHNQQR